MIFGLDLSMGQGLSLLPKVQSMDTAEELRKFSENYGKFLAVSGKGGLPGLGLPLIGQSEVLEGNSSTKTPEPLALVLGTRLALPIIKSKYFSFKIFLKQQPGFSLPINQPISLEVLIFSQDAVLITRNMKGKEILRGNSLQSTSFSASENTHTAYFRIQVTEVSSHYIGKTLILKIQPKKNEFLETMGWKIHPFSMELSVKAKDLKTKTK